MTAPFQYFTRPDPGEPLPQIQLAELVGTLSRALDMTEGQAPGHCIRACWIGTHIGMQLGLDQRALSDLFFTLLLKDLGCSSNAARICQLYLTDDIGFKKDFKSTDKCKGGALRRVLARTAPEARLSTRIKTIINVLQNGGDIATSLIETRCRRGAEIAGAMRFSPGVQSGIRHLDEHWDGGGQPHQLRGPTIPIQANIALLAQVVDVFHRGQGNTAARAEVRRRAGTWFDPRIVDAFEKLADQPGFWTDLNAPDLEARLFVMHPATQSATVDQDWLDDIAGAFADVIDSKSPFTADHSRRVSEYADLIGAELGLAADHRRWLRRAALLHDLGKLAVSNRILDKPDRLDEAEWTVIRQHSWHSQNILEQISALADIAPVAGAHHERLDGKGYPHGLGAADLGLEVRILTVADVFDALSADRPYRGALSLDEVYDILDSEVGTALDGDCVAALKSAIARVQSAA